MTTAKPRNLRWWTLALLALATGWLGGVWPPPVWWRSHWPARTAMMRAELRRHEPQRPAATPLPAPEPVPLSAITPLLQRLVILAEDDRFRSHHGVDFVEVREAITAAWRRERLRGASTITQQLAKNLYLSPSRNPLRKLKEVVTAVRLDLVLSKDRILELYLNVAQFGPGLWGVEAASRVYFGVPASRLDLWQAASLAATLPHPRSSNPAYQPARMAARRDLILARYGGVDVEIPQIDELDSMPELPPITAPLIPPAVDSLLGDSVRPDSGRDTTTTDGQMGQHSADAQTR